MTKHLKARLKDAQIRKLRHVRGLHSDGNRLHIEGGKVGSWVFRYRLSGRPKTPEHPRDEVWLGLGSLNDLPAPAAREIANEYSELLARGGDPATERAKRRQQQALEAAAAITFETCARNFVEQHKHKWKGTASAEQWLSSFVQHVFPKLGGISVAAVDTPHVMQVLQPIWISRATTAERIQGRIENVLDFAKVSGFRAGENPARWRGHLEVLLPKVPKQKRVVHLPSLPYEQVPQLIAELRAVSGVPARALEFTILVAARSGETIGALWSEMDLQKRVWSIPGERMKAARAHRVPLSEEAIALLEALPRQGEYVFPGKRETLHINSMQRVLQRMRRGVTVHGFRSSFRTWAAECTTVPREICEAALAHTVGSEVERSYFRSDLLQKRAALMQQWAQFCYHGAPDSNVVPLATIAR